jgi:hypothetical protein
VALKKSTKTKACTQCNATATGTRELRKVFGFRNTNDPESPYYMMPHSWCNECRSSARKDSQPAPKAKLELPKSFVALRRAVKMEYPNNKKVMANAATYRRLLLETGKYE